MMKSSNSSSFYTINQPHKYFFIFNEIFSLLSQKINSFIFFTEKGFGNLSLKPIDFFGIVGRIRDFLRNGHGTTIQLSNFSLFLCFSMKNISFGDFERTFLKTCVQNNPTFINAFKSEENFEIKFLNLNFQFCK